ncbi:hypothetical protein CR513_44529, partial [Mucuna pruriens]
MFIAKYMLAIGSQEGKKVKANSIKKTSSKLDLIMHAKARSTSNSEERNLFPSGFDSNTKHNAESNSNPTRTGYTPGQYESVTTAGVLSRLESVIVQFTVSSVPNEMDHLLLLMSFPMNENTNSTFQVNEHQIKLFHEGPALIMAKMESISLMEPAPPDDSH